MLVWPLLVCLGINVQATSQVSALSAVRSNHLSPSNDDGPKKMNAIDAMRADLCYKRVTTNHDDCMEWLVDKCTGKQAGWGDGVCAKTKNHVKEHCMKGNEKACDYARQLGMDPSGWDKAGNSAEGVSTSGHDHGHGKEEGANGSSDNDHHGGAAEGRAGSGAGKNAGDDGRAQKKAARGGGADTRSSAKDGAGHGAGGGSHDGAGHGDGRGSGGHAGSHAGSGAHQGGGRGSGAHQSGDGGHAGSHAGSGAGKNTDDDEKARKGADGASGRQSWWSWWLSWWKGDGGHGHDGSHGHGGDSEESGALSSGVHILTYVAVGTLTFALASV